MWTGERIRARRGSQRGNVALMLALLLVPLLAATGAAADYLRYTMVKSQLQSVIDSAALAAASRPNITTDQVNTILKDYVAANLPRGVAIDPIQNAVLDPAANTLRFGITGHIDTYILGIVGVPGLRLDATAVVTRARLAPLEMVMALDYTNSMLDTPHSPSQPGEAAKYVALQGAAKKLAEGLMATDNVRVGIVPFTTYINIGTAYNEEPWLRLPTTIQRTNYPSVATYGPDQCMYDGKLRDCRHDTYDYTQPKIQDFGFNGCVGLRRNTVDPPSAQPKVTPSESMIAANESVIPDAVPAGQPNPQTTQEVFSVTELTYADFLPPNLPAGTLKGDVPYMGVRLLCVGPQILDLRKRSDGGGTKGYDDVVAKIDALVPKNHPQVRETFIPGGLMWAWNMLTNDPPIETAVSADAATATSLRKALLLMTDGENTAVINAWGTEFYARYANGTAVDASQTDQMTTEMCNGIKADGIIIYTVAFALPDGSAAKTILEDCASPSSTGSSANLYYDVVSNEELYRAFDDIGASLMQVRLVE